MIFRLAMAASLPVIVRQGNQREIDPPSFANVGLFMQGWCPNPEALALTIKPVMGSRSMSWTILSKNPLTGTAPPRIRLRTFHVPFSIATRFTSVLCAFRCVGGASLCAPDKRVLGEIWRLHRLAVVTDLRAGRPGRVCRIDHPQPICKVDDHAR